METSNEAFKIIGNVTGLAYLALLIAGMVAVPIFAIWVLLSTIF